MKRLQRLAASLFIINASSAMLHAEADLVLVENVTVIDAIQGAQPGMRVLIEDARIILLEPATGTAPVADTVIDGRKHYLLPGLWDTHAHYSSDGQIEPLIPRLMLAHGITQVRDTGGQLAKARSFAADAKARPQALPAYFFSGPLLDGEPPVYDGSAPAYPALSRTVTSPGQAVAAVNEFAAAGASLVKAYEMLQPEVFLAIVERAHQLGLPVTGHVPLAMNIQEVTNSGIDSLEHLRNLELDCSSDAERMLSERRDMLSNAGDTPGHTLRSKAHTAHRIPAIESLDWDRCLAVLEQQQAAGLRHVPTLALILSVYEKFHATPEWRQTFEVLPPSLRDDWLEQSKRMEQLFVNDPGGDPGRAAYIAWVKKVVAWLADKHMLMAGTDTPLFFMTPGLALHKELEVMVEAGLTPLQALEAATLTPARYFRLENDMGSVAVGRRADLLLLGADPLEDIRNTRAIEAVILAGQLYDRKALDRLLAQIAGDQAPAP